MIIINFISLILDGILSVMLNNGSILLPLFSLVSLIIVYPYLTKKENIFIYSMIIGYLYDIVYTQTPFLNTILFIVLSIGIYCYYNFLPISFFNSLVLVLITILLFRIFTYFILVFVGVINTDYQLLFESIYASLLSNIIYYVMVSFILKRYFNKKGKKHYGSISFKRWTNVRKKYWQR